MQFECSGFLKESLAYTACDATHATVPRQRRERRRRERARGRAGPQGPPCLFGSGTPRRTGSRRPTLRTSRAMPRAALQSPAGPVGRTTLAAPPGANEPKPHAGQHVMAHFHTFTHARANRTHARMRRGQLPAARKHRPSRSHIMYIYIIAYIIRRAACISANHPSEPIHQARPIALPPAMPKLLKFRKFLPTDRKASDRIGVSAHQASIAPTPATPTSRW